MRDWTFPKTLRLAALALFFAAPASAATMKAVFSGAMTSGYTYGGVFGPDSYPGAETSFTATVVYDTTLGRFYSSTTEESVFGGSDNGSTSPITSITLTVGSATVSYLPQNYGAFILRHGSFVGAPFVTFTVEGALNRSVDLGGGDAEAQENEFYIFFRAARANSDTDPDLTRSYDVSSAGQGAAYGEFYHYRLSPYLQEYGSGQFNLTSVVISEVEETPLPSVPVPAGLPLLASALGLGLVLRRKR